MISMSEKDFLKQLHSQRLGNGNSLSWRDDSIVASPGDGYLVYSLDRPERVRHTSDVLADLRHFGRWSAGLVANDVIAEGARPQGISFDVGNSTFEDEDQFAAWAEGVLDVCKAYDMVYEGGNIGVGPDVVGMAYGFTDRPIRRSGSAVGDLLIATWSLGVGWAKRMLTGQQADVWFQDFPIVVSHQDEPWINLNCFADIWATGAITSGMDLTDGAVEFAHEIWEQTQLGVVLSLQSEPSEAVRSAAETLNVPAWSLMLEPGYDTPYAHGWTVRRDSIDLVSAELARHGVPYTVFGEVVDGGKGVQIDVGGSQANAPRYWDDVFDHRGSVDRWRSTILNLFETVG